MAVKKNLPAPRAKQDIVDWSSMLKESAAKTKQAAAALGTGSRFISFKGGALIVDGGARNPSWMRCIVLATMNERAFYEGAFIPDTPRGPICYAYGSVDEGETEAPHDESRTPQHETCAGCPNAEWGTADTGRGQACKQYLRLALIEVAEKPAPEEIAKAQIYFARIPATSLKNAKAWLDYFSAASSAPFAWVSVLEVKPSTVSMLTAHLSPESEILPGLRPAVLARLAQARKEIAEPYPDFEEMRKQAPAPAPRTAAPVGKKRF